MVVTLLVYTFVIAFTVASIVVFIFNKPINGILKRVVPADTTMGAPLSQPAQAAVQAVTESLAEILEDLTLET
jgi:hypothetical protein